MGWDSTVLNDYDRDGLDFDEDLDDDNDGVDDVDDLCPQGYLSWQSSADTDYDGDDAGMMEKTSMMTMMTCWMRTMHSHSTLVISWIQTLMELLI